MKNRLSIIFVFVIFSALVLHAKDDMISRLDDAISKRTYYQQIKENRIDSLRNLLSDRQHYERKFELYNALFDEFLTFNYDSAMVYVDKAAKLVDDTADYNVRSQIEINRARSLAASGHFSHAIDILDAIDSRRLSRTMQEEYFAAEEWTYGVWSEYSDKRTIAPEFTAKCLLYLDSLIAVTDRAKAEYPYRMAEHDLRMKNYKDAERNYVVALGMVPNTSRLYAQASYALALTYKAQGDKAKYKEWLINAAISDQIIPLKENLALQQLAMYLKADEGNVEKANEYLSIALDDAIFYNNRLRMLEIAEKIPDIANVYQSTIQQQNGRLKTFVVAICVLMVLLVCAMIYVYRQHRKVSRANERFAELNEKLKQLNVQLSNTNTQREQYVSLFIDLCAAYIDKLNRFPTVLKMKVKNMNDLSSVADRYVRPSEFETREMFFNFDTAFLSLYPDFIKEINLLLQPDKQLTPKKGELLNTDLRIYALVRMGIADSNKIATMLFLSPQTIFNHRTQVRNRAINRDTFEAEVLKICDVI